MWYTARELRRLILAGSCLAALLGGLACRAPERTPSPPPRDIALTPDSETVRGRFPADVTLERLLRDHVSRQDLVPSFVSAASAAFDPRRFRANQPYRLTRSLDGALRAFEYEIDRDRFLRVAPPDDGSGAPATAAILPYDTQKSLVALSGEITREVPSLFGAMEKAGEAADLSIAVAEVFGGDIDFNTDLQPGDRFRVTVEKIYREEGFSGYGAVMAAEFVNGDRRLRAIRFTPPGGTPGYYDEQGRSLKRFLLASPLKFAPRITSRYSGRRFHPVLRIYRPHLGVDYAAPVGSPVVASAAGVVIQAGWNGDGGRTVQIRHPNGYETLYMHLSSIAEGVRPGARLAQGDPVGRVGTSGLSSGPHLDYRIRKNGVYVNPVTEHKRMPPGAPIAEAHMAAFGAERDRSLAGLDRAPSPGQPAAEAARVAPASQGSPEPRRPTWD